MFLCFESFDTILSNLKRILFSSDTAYVNKLFPGSLKEDMYKIFYTSFGQKISIANYWKGGLL